MSYSTVCELSPFTVTHNVINEMLHTIQLRDTSQFYMFESNNKSRYKFFNKIILTYNEVFVNRWLVFLLCLSNPRTELSQAEESLYFTNVHLNALFST